MTSPSIAFIDRKQAILKDLSKPDDLYSDLSPKGAIDREILDLVQEVNSYEGLVTTSSCSGRISIFVEGTKDIKANKTGHERSGEETSGSPVRERISVARNGGKGGGGRWLFVSHEPLNITNHLEYPNCTRLFGLEVDSKVHDVPVANPESQRFIHFKFEPMILHVLAASPYEARNVLAAAHEAGFRESGAASFPVDRNSAFQGPEFKTSPIPIAIRTSGLAFDNIIGLAVNADEESPELQNLVPMVSENHIRTLVGIANVKFQINMHRKRRFGELLAARMNKFSLEPVHWESTAARKERKHREGLERQNILRQQRFIVSGDNANETDVKEFLDS